VRDGTVQDILVFAPRNPGFAEALLISIVDDDESVREATKGLVRSLGYGAAAFASAEEFLQSKQINDTECVISDVQMSGLSGVELQSKLIADGNRTPIIFITASQEERTHAKALNAGAIGVLSKPFNEERLIEYIRTALAVRKIEPVRA
jgi:FixJ family two-component response regulator